MFFAAQAAKTTEEPSLPYRDDSVRPPLRAGHLILFEPAGSDKG